MLFVNITLCFIFSTLINPHLAQPSLRSNVDEPLFEGVYFMNFKKPNGYRYTNGYQKDLTGYKFGIMEVIKFDKIDEKSHRARWFCKCQCGTIKSMSYSSIHGTTVSCGCIKKQQIERNHYSVKTPLYHKWNGMKRRCYDEKDRHYRWYGARGIKMCDEWRNDFRIFQKWAFENGLKEDL